MSEPSKEKFTPWPWRLGFTKSHGFGYVNIVGADDNSCAHAVFHRSCENEKAGVRGFDEVIANASLIAAAPEMYKSIELNCSACDRGRTSDGDGCDDCVFNGILKKARGEQ